jgi:cyanophycinase
MRPVVLLAALLSGNLSYRYFVTGNSANVDRKYTSAFALIGGGEDLDEVGRWFLGKAPVGDLLVLRASGDDAYNPYFFKLAPLNSAQTLIVASPEAARDRFVTDKVNHAEAIFIAGGDQWNYVHLWNHSPLGDALRVAVQRGVPIGGTSAGLAVMGEYIFSAEHDTVTSPEALHDPYSDRVTLAHNFLGIAALKNTITDSHFKGRDRMGRTLVFLARILQDFPVTEARAIAIDERTAVLLETDGSLRVAGVGSVYFLRARHRAEICRSHAPLTMSGVEVYRASAGSQFDTSLWTGTGGKSYLLNVSAGSVTSNQPNAAIY